MRRSSTQRKVISQKKWASLRQTNPQNSNKGCSCQTHHLQKQTTTFCTKPTGVSFWWKTIFLLLQRGDHWTAYRNLASFKSPWKTAFCGQNSIILSLGAHVKDMVFFLSFFLLLDLCIRYSLTDSVPNSKKVEGAHLVWDKGKVWVTFLWFDKIWPLRHQILASSWCGEKPCREKWFTNSERLCSTFRVVLDQFKC